MRVAISLRSGRRFFRRLELGEGRLVVVARERAIEIDLRVGIELLDARRDPVGLHRGPFLVQRLEVRVQGRDVVGKSLREVRERAHSFAAPAETPVEKREVLEHLGLAPHPLRKLRGGRRPPPRPRAARRHRRWT